MYGLEVKPTVDRVFKKLSNKNKKQLMIIHKKIEDIRRTPHHSYKFLRNRLCSYNRVHIDKHFVLIFKIDHKREMVVIYYFDHHDSVYKWNPE